MASEAHARACASGAGPVCWRMYAPARRTLAAIEKGLYRDGFVLRYDTGVTEDGLPPGEGAFLACSFWLAECLARQGVQPFGSLLFSCGGRGRSMFAPALRPRTCGVRVPRFCQTLARARPESLNKALTIAVAL